MNQKSTIKSALRELETVEQLRSALAKFTAALEAANITLPEPVSGDLVGLRSAVDGAARVLVGVSEKRIQDALERAKKQTDAIGS